MFTQLYNEYKSDVGFSEKEILNKSKSIRGYLEPFTEKKLNKFFEKSRF